MLQIGTRLGALKAIGLIKPEGGEGQSGLGMLLSVSRLQLSLRSKRS